MSALATAVGKHFVGKFTVKIDSFRYLILVSYIVIADADSESLKSLHTLFDKYSNHMLVKFE